MKIIGRSEKETEQNRRIIFRVVNEALRDTIGLFLGGHNKIRKVFIAMRVSKNPDFYVKKYGCEVKSLIKLEREASLEAYTKMQLTLDVTLVNYRAPLAELWVNLTEDQQAEVQKWDKKLLKFEHFFQINAGLSVKKKLKTIHTRKSLTAAAQTG